ncbi:MAG: YggT family protein [Rhodospirillaceae bacterium]|nr:YggT family protein [Rhodospirillaceae bacterium]MBL6933667.1 YggT family protein [Rhodospirillales bacterium]
MEVIAGPVLKLLLTVIDLYVWIIVIGVILSWLTAFGVVNSSNRFVYIVGDFIQKITEPALRPIRNFLPVMGGFDLSPVALILILILVQDVLINLIVKLGG